MNAVTLEKAKGATAKPARKTPTKRAIANAFDKIQMHLTDAMGADESHAWSGDSDRLIVIANDLADKAAIKPPLGIDASGLGYDIAALIRAARLVPGDVESDARTAHLEAILAPLQLICETTNTNLINPGAARPPAPNLGGDPERDFMEGKALAALMVREGHHRSVWKDGELNASLNASYRGAKTSQDNFTAPFLALLQKEPHLVPGFTAALSSMLAEGFTEKTTAANMAFLSYSACTVFRDATEYEDFDAYSEPPLDEQLANFGLQDYVTTEAPTKDAAPPGKDIARAAGTKDTSAELAYYCLSQANAVVRAAAEEDTGLTTGEALYAAARVIDLAKDCVPLGDADWSGISAAGTLASQAVAVMMLVAQNGGDLLADAGLTLLRAAQQHLSDAEREVPRA